MEAEITKHQSLKMCVYLHFVFMATFEGILDLGGQSFIWRYNNHMLSSFLYNYFIILTVHILKSVYPRTIAVNKILLMTIVKTPTCFRIGLSH
jgi:hypothetical protein